MSLSLSSRFLAAVLILNGVAACASMPMPREEVAAADLALREAEESDAPTYAPAPLRQARQKLKAAEEAMRAENEQRARRLAEQALVDAQFAQARARSVIAEQSLEEMRRSIEDLRNEAIPAAAGS